MRQHIINGMNVSGNAGDCPMNANVAVRDRDALRHPTGKRLTKVSVSQAGQVRPSSVTPGVECRSDRHMSPSMPLGSPATVWPQAAFEPPAAAWASLVISRAISA
jgi:hypothetical protein